jgi:ubiquinone/menaquinone biosynthesis C-methylase UbiE
MNNQFKEGSSIEFDENWKLRKETYYSHWRRGAPRNQIQLAFRNHFEVFSRYLQKDGSNHGACLEIGAGRGSISSFFADAGYRCTLLDTSAAVLDVARGIYERNGHEATFVVGDANQLDFHNDTFDVVVSIGLLEHFEDIVPPLREQLRILRPGGRCFCYVVPENPQNVQKYFRFINIFLRTFSSNKRSAVEYEESKKPIFRTASSSCSYLQALEAMGAKDINAIGMYPMPMISPSPEFPFTLMSAPMELVLTCVYRVVLKIRGLLKSEHPWTCDETFGQAFLVTFRK